MLRMPKKAKQKKCHPLLSVSLPKASEYILTFSLTSSLLKNFKSDTTTPPRRLQPPFQQRVLHLHHLLLMFKTTDQRVPMKTFNFNTLSVMERRRLSVYVSFMYLNFDCKPQQTFPSVRNQLFCSGRQVKRMYQRRKKMQKFLCSEQKKNYVVIYLF